MLGGPGQNTSSGQPWPAHPRRPQSLRNQWTATDHVKAPPPNHLHSNTHKGWTQQAPEPCWVSPVPWSGPLHNWSSMVVGGWWSVVTASPCSWLACVNPSHDLPIVIKVQLPEVYTTHMVGTPWVSTLGDRGGCAAGPDRTPTTLGHSTEPGSCSSSS